MINIKDDYLSYRTIKIRKTTIKVIMGVPQISKLGPTLWHLLYDGLLKLRKRFPTIAFAVDLDINSRTHSKLEDEKNTRETTSKTRLKEEVD